MDFRVVPEFVGFALFWMEGGQCLETVSGDEVESDRHDRICGENNTQIRLKKMPWSNLH